MKIFSIAISLIFTCRTIIPACTCVPVSSNFCGTIDSSGADLIIKGIKISQVFHGMEVKVLEVLIGNELNDTIMVWGDDGALCRVYTGTFNISDTIILALYYTDFMHNILNFDSIEQPGDYHLSVCGVYYLHLFNNLVVGNVSDTIQQMKYNDFKSLVYNCFRKPITNAGFENWSWIGGWYENPDNWGTNNSQLFTPVQKDTNSYQGNYAIKIGILPGFEFTPGIAQTYFPISLIPESLTAFVKCNVMPGDTVYIKTYFYSADSIIASGQWYSTTSISNYTFITIPINNQNFNTVDSCKIELISGCCAVLGGAQNGTELIVDELSNNFLPLGISFNHGFNEKNNNLLLYPNPFNEATTIEYILKENSLVKLNIYNLYGQFVTKLVNEINQPKGKYQIRFDASNLAPGLYFCLIQTNGYTAFHKFSVVK